MSFLSLKYILRIAEDPKMFFFINRLSGEWDDHISKLETGLHFHLKCVTDLRRSLEITFNYITFTTFHPTARVTWNIFHLLYQQTQTSWSPRCLPFTVGWPRHPVFRFHKQHEGNLLSDSRCHDSESNGRQFGSDDWCYLHAGYKNRQTTSFQANALK